MRKINYKIVLACVLVMTIIGGSIIYYLYDNNQNTESDIALEVTTTTTIETTSNNETYYVDIKGAVKKAGVYEVKQNSRIIDVINKAGGLKVNASTSNINLSQKIEDQMVIYIFTKSELKSKNISYTCDNKCTTNVIEVNNCVNEETSTTKSSSTTSSTLININTATQEQLMTLSGVGESKAKSIIEYRNKTKFEKIEDIINVSGIGESAFAKIKDNITV